MDKQGCVLVADYGNHRITSLDPSLTNACEITLSVEMEGPLSLCLDESRGRLYVGENYAQRRVLVFDNFSDIFVMFIT